MMRPLPDTTPAAELRKLAHTEPGLRAAIAGHPNAPAPLLAELAAEFPGEVLHNPALVLLRLAQPDFLQRWPQQALEQLTAQPDAPDWLLRLAARHPVIDVQLAAVVHPDLPTDVVERLAASPFWTIREYVARKAELPVKVLELLVDDPDYGVRITVAGRSDLSPTQRQRLQQDEHPLIRAVMALQ